MYLFMLRGEKYNRMLNPTEDCLTVVKVAIALNFMQNGELILMQCSGTVLSRGCAKAPVMVSASCHSNKVKQCTCPPSLPSSHGRFLFGKPCPEFLQDAMAVCLAGHESRDVCL